VVEEGVRRMSLDSRQLAWLVLEAVNRIQGKRSTVRLVAPRDEEVTRQLDPTLDEHELFAAEVYLRARGYIASANLGLTSAVYTITTTGLDWLDEGFPWPSEALLVAGEEPERAQPWSASGGPHEGAEPRAGWRRAFGG
jgi:hypothetical protein